MSASLYVVSNGQSVKLGRAKNVRGRLTYLQVGSAVPLTLAHEVSVEHPVDVERVAHSLLKAKRQTGEWFDVAVDAAAEAVCSMTGVNPTYSNTKDSWRLGSTIDVERLMRRQSRKP